MEILNGDSYLIREFFDAMFTKFEIPILDVIEKIFTLHVLEDNVVIIRVLEQIN